jgi:RNA recognition motif-containing protein
LPIPQADQIGQKQNRDQLFVGRLPADTTRDILVSTFSSYGSIKRLFFNDHKKIAYLSYRDERAVQRVLAAKEIFVTTGSGQKKSVAVSRNAFLH